MMVIIRKERIMKKTELLEGSLGELISKKLLICECNPCKCSEQKKDEYFQELRYILTRYNMEKFAFYLDTNQFQKTSESLKTLLIGLTYSFTVI